MAEFADRKSREGQDKKGTRVLLGIVAALVVMFVLLLNGWLDHKYGSPPEETQNSAKLK